MYLDEAQSVADSVDFSGRPDQAMFWAHIDYHCPQFSYERNQALCDSLAKASIMGPYSMHDLPDFVKITGFFQRYLGDYSSDILDQAWDIFSKHYAEQAAGDHVYLAVNDMKPDDYFIRAELPILRDNFTRVTTLEATEDKFGNTEIRQTEWDFKRWEQAQRVQWQNPGHFLDGTTYPAGLFLPR